MSNDLTLQLDENSVQNCSIAQTYLLIVKDANIETDWNITHTDSQYEQRGKKSRDGCKSSGTLPSTVHTAPAYRAGRYSGTLWDC